MKRSLCLFAFPFLIGGAAFAQSPDSLIIAGGGVAGKWDTEIELANTSAEPIEAVLSIHGLPLGAPCNCTSKGYAIPGHGTILVLASDFIGAFYPGPQMIRVDAGDAPLPVAHARAISKGSASQFAELPVTRESSLSAADRSVLVFPGARRSDGVYSNLILESLGPDATSTSAVLVEVFDSEGRRRGSVPLIVTGESTIQAVTLVDVVGAAGVSALDGGQVRVTRTAGPGVLWGALATVYREGFLQVSVGANP